MAVDYAALGQLLDSLSKGYLKDWVDRNRPRPTSLVIELWTT